MKSLTLVSTLLGSAAALNVVKFPIQGRQTAQQLSKRATIEGVLHNELSEKVYSLNLTVGTPPQSFSLQLDTGSSDLWVNTQSSSLCQAGNCTNGIYDPSASSTYKVSLPGGFNISYADHTGCSGDYVNETVSINGVEVTNQVIGVANVSTIPIGLIGVGFDIGEAICDTYACENHYPSIIDTLVAQGKINTAAYSLWLDDLNSSAGSILFGGIDHSKYYEPLTVMDILPSHRSADGTPLYEKLFVVWTDLKVSGIDNLWNSSDTIAALLDSGTSDTYVPSDVFDKIAEEFNIKQGYIECAARDMGATFNFTFDGSAVISVPIAEFIFEADGATIGGQPACPFRLFASDNTDHVLLGDTFLRSAYVVYDLQGKTIAIAQTNFNGGAENIVEINGAIPDVTATAVYTPGVTTPTATGPVGPSSAGSATGTSSASPSTYTGAAVKSGHELGLAGSLAALMAFAMF